jgi:hypothetical protein
LRLRRLALLLCGLLAATCPGACGVRAALRLRRFG